MSIDNATPEEWDELRTKDRVKDAKFPISSRYCSMFLTLSNNIRSSIAFLLSRIIRKTASAK